MMTTNYKTLWEILTAILVILPFAISVWACFRQNRWPKNYHLLSPTHSNGKTIINYQDEFERFLTTWHSMLVHGSLYSNARGSWNYDQLSRLIEWGLTTSIAWKGNFGWSFQVCSCRPLQHLLLKFDLLSKILRKRYLWNWMRQKSVIPYSLQPVFDFDYISTLAVFIKTRFVIVHDYFKELISNFNIVLRTGNNLVISI